MENAAGKLISRDDVAVIIIDIQERLLPAIYDGETMLRNAMKLIYFTRLIKLPVLLTEQEKLGPTVRQIREELASVQPVNKVEFDACRNKEFLDRLTKLNKNTLIVAGIESHICVTQTVLHLLPRYNIHVLSDAVSSRLRDNWRVGLERMRDAGAVISSAEMAIYELMQKADTEEFKATLKVVK